MRPRRWREARETEVPCKAHLGQRGDLCQAAVPSLVLRLQAHKCRWLLEGYRGTPVPLIAVSSTAWHVTFGEEYTGACSTVCMALSSGTGSSCTKASTCALLAAPLQLTAAIDVITATVCSARWTTRLFATQPVGTQQVATKLFTERQESSLWKWIVYLDLNSQHQEALVPGR